MGVRVPLWAHLEIKKHIFIFVNIKQLVMTEFSFFVMGVIGTLLTSTIVSMIDFKLTLNNLKRSLTDIKSVREKREELLDKKIDSEKENLIKFLKSNVEHLNSNLEVLQKRQSETFEKLNTDSINGFDKIHNRTTFEVDKLWNRITDEVNVLRNQIASRQIQNYDDSHIINKMSELEKKLDYFITLVSNIDSKKTRK